jgi:hypothetical protein
MFMGRAGPERHGHDRRAPAGSATAVYDHDPLCRELGPPRLGGELLRRGNRLMNDADEERLTLAATAILRIVDGMPRDLAISALMMVVADLIRSSREPAIWWAALAYGVEVNSRLQHRVISDPPERLQ